MKDYKKYYILAATPEEVYHALTFAPTMQLWTGDKVVMEEIPDSEFSLWDGSIVGRNISFEPHKQIVQEWYFGEQVQASIVTIKLHEHQSGTSVELRHTNIPDESYDEMVEGWNQTYFGSLIDFYKD